MSTTRWRTLRRRSDALLLRWHARLDSDWADRTLPWLLTAAVFVLFAGLSLARNRMIEHGPELASYAQGAWLIAEGHEPVLTLMGAPLLHLHGSLLFYPLAVLTHWLPVQPTLLVAQAAALAYAVVPFWRLARRVVLLQVGAATALVAAFALHPVTQNANLSGFRPETLAVPAVMAMCYRGITGSTVRFAAAAGVIVLARADLAVVVGSIGLFFALRGRPRAGGAVAAAAAAWLMAALTVSWLGAGDGSAPHPGAFERFGQGLGGVVAGVFADPLDTLGWLVRRENLDLAVLLVLPLALLPLVGWRWLLPALPWLVFVGLGDLPPEVRLGALALPVLGLFLVAAAEGFGAVGRRALERVVVPPQLVGALVAATLAFWATAAVSTPYETPWAWGARDAADRAKIDAAELVGPEDVVQATPQLTPLVAERIALFDIRSAGQLRPDTDALFLDVAELAEGDALGRRAPPGYVTAYDEEGVVLYLRAEDPSGDADA